jgi:uncharacterized damage-inducible protein DinB
MSTSNPVITPTALLKHWQGHRALTRRVIEAFPEDKLFTFSVGGMRAFSELAFEFLRLSAPGLRGIVTGDWSGKPEPPTTKADLLKQWDAATAEIDALWARIPESRFQETVKAWGQWEGPVYSNILYWIDNEIHHRGQGYVYLRALGVAPPGFWER